MNVSTSWFPLSHGQEALWFLWKLSPKNFAYNIPLNVGVRGQLDVTAFERAMRRLARRHPSLRTAFREDVDGPRQRPIDEHQLEISHTDASSWSEARVRQAVTEEARRPFDLATDAVMRCALFHRSDDLHEFLLVIHHITGDLWSLVVMMDELRRLYSEETGGAGAALPDLALRYEDFVTWQRGLMAGKAGEHLWNYWRETLAGEIPILDPPVDHSRPPIQSFRGGTVVRRLGPETGAAQRALATAEGTTLFVVLLAAYQVLLHRFTGQDSLIIGSPTSGRHRAELADLVGDFVDMVPIRCDLQGGPSFRDVLGQAKRQVVGALKHQDYPFSLLVERLKLPRDLSRSPVFQTTFVLQSFQRYEEFSRVLLPDTDEPSIPFADLQLEPRALAQQDGQFDVNLEMKEDEKGGLVCAWKYATDLFEASTIERLAECFETLLNDIAVDPARPVSELRLQTTERADAALAESRGPAETLPAATSIFALFEEQAAQRGDAIAIRHADEAVTYAELSERVARLATGIAALGVQKDDLVAVLMGRGIEFISVLLAISRAGAAFLPLDPRHPNQRLGQILDDGGVRLVLTDDRFGGEDSDAGYPVEQGSRDFVHIKDLDTDGPVTPAAPIDGRDLAYVMYTSGSTGRPKGVMVEHAGMVNHVLAKLEDLEMDAAAALAQNGPISFDIVVWQCLAPLAIGARVEVFSDAIAEDPAALLAEVERTGVTALQIVPSMLQAVLDEAEAEAETQGAPPPLGTLKWMVPTGEALPTLLCRRWLKLYPDIPILNTYGSTECSDDQCHYTLRQVDGADRAVALASIGRPIRNMAAYVLDDGLNPVPVGIVGELYIGGLGVGRGYVNDPERTAPAFIPDPFAREPGARLYRTRDLARRRPDLALDFLGRVDHMIKLRGFRIEPGEIEAALAGHASVSEAAVTARAHPSGERQLVAYVVPAGDPATFPDTEALRRYLTDHLPLYMVPAVYRQCESLPLTANGKLDLKRLPEPDWAASQSETYKPPSTATEETMAAIWADVLGLERIGVDDNFFAVGGDSIRSIQIVARFKRAGLNIRPSDLFLHQNIAALAAFADGAAALDATVDAMPEMEGSDNPLSGNLQPSREHLDRAFAQVSFDAD